MIRFGTGGNSNSFYEEKHKSTIEAMKWLSDRGLNAYEYEATRGVNISETSACKIKEEAEKYDIKLSVHAPYFITLSTEDPDKQLKTIKYIIDSMKLALWLGTDRIVVHAGSMLNLTREQAMENACNLLQRSIEAAKSEGLYEKVHICPETMGKQNQLGSMEEIIRMCLLDKMLIPTIDFGHINARTLGGLKVEKDFKDLLVMCITELGFERMEHFHCHFSKIEYTTGGEKKHLNFDEDDTYGPDFSILGKVLKELKLEPIIICESAGMQAEDALKMKVIYESI